MKTPYYLVILISFLIFNTSSVKAQQVFDHTLWDDLLLLNVSDDGMVNYKGFMLHSAKLYEYFGKLSENPPTEDWNQKETLAYWINAYNAYTIKLIIDNYPLKSIKDIKHPWDNKFFKIDGEWYSLNDLEHKILRKLEEPRIHFAINCASYSCPVVWNRAYTGENVNEALEKQTASFINDPERNTITKDVVAVSKIFDWFKKDFKINGGNVKDFINKYSTIKINKQPNKGYKEYNWNLNE